MMNFDDLDIEITEESHPSAIYERSKENPNKFITVPCDPYTGSLDDYAKNLAKEMFQREKV